ncbi:class I SAM-dependent methyltransferase [Undibacterium arcticum]|uniref:Class I SAM-dependent methyltransferase n=1 Tax=Undibacterium arcticum TaxID=1762892 RepID=A0ABV7F5S6_9BURK
MNQHLTPNQASAWVSRFAALIPPGEVLDLACGSGRHVRLLAQLGHPVLALDRDADALANTAGPGISVMQFDLENAAADQPVWPFDADRFAGIVVTNYLHRPLFPHLFDSLAPGGVLIYETFASGNGQFGKPSNPDFLLAPAELLHLAQANVGGQLRVIAFEDGLVEHPRPAMVQRICVLKPTGQILPHSVRLDFPSD